MKLTTIAMSSLLILTTLSGCNLHSAFDMGKDTPLSQNQLCNRLKRDIMFHNYDSNHDTEWTSPARQADILRQYRDNNCEAILSGKAEAKAEDAQVPPLKLPGDKSSTKDKIHVTVE